MEAKITTSDLSTLGHHIYAQSNRQFPSDRKQKKPAKRRISVSHLPRLGSLKSTETLDHESLDPKRRKLAKKLATGAWKGAKVSAKLLVIAPYLPMVLFLVLCDWLQQELDGIPVKEDVGSISDWSTSTL
ncbi:hypothetical protein PG996_009976 [Apiospora saccharicola]|uniref:Uncharacterized protein n=1 Tax=Apiospora saccharicola TaxID=335842 RepID=A0ABR1UMA6_9PEZI